MKIKDFKFKKQFRDAVIKKIKELRKKGATFQEIADLFNEEEYDLLGESGKWWMQAVHRLSQE